MTTAVATSYFVPRDLILVRRHAVAEETESGLYIPKIAQEEPISADVLEVGKDVVEVQKGDVVRYTKYSGTPVTIDGEELLVVKEGDIRLIERA